jgi:hypothetical protein
VVLNKGMLQCCAELKRIAAVLSVMVFAMLSSLVALQLYSRGDNHNNKAASTDCGHIIVKVCQSILFRKIRVGPRIDSCFRQGTRVFLFIRVMSGDVIISNVMSNDVP